MRIVLLLALAAFWYHLFAGCRHLAWDAGHGFEKRSRVAPVRSSSCSRQPPGRNAHP
jgi:succinate dehydrogenase/fumarate reductase cytochrome b subunit